MSSSKKPLIDIPSSEATCTVRVIDTTSIVHYPAKYFFTEPISSHTDLNCPSYSFLVTDASGKRHVLFDLGVRKDWETGYPEHLLKTLKGSGAYLEVEYDVAEILDKEPSSDALPKSKDIEAIIWSHHHFDHTGNPTLFPSQTSLVVGPGFKEANLPGYPQDKESATPSSLWEGRDLIEVNLQNDKRAVKLGPFEAIDYFEDGSFYLIGTPGHAPAHLSGLARVTPSTFVMMGGDAAHHGGEIRPTQYLPLPATLSLPSSKKYSVSGCPGEILAGLQPGRKGSTTTPFYDASKDFCVNKDEAVQSVKGITELDASDDIFVILAHERSLQSKIPLFPKAINDWRKKDIDASTRWLFVDDFAGAADEAS
ncbi:hypothetical protein CBS101457_003071 [Exobasidium rhododendri]|nr:hypothetical protein CBS101457_003071 [Exobasidium rhododendri]